MELTIVQDKSSDVSQKAQKRVGLLGGSFNPAHHGHRDIAIAAIDALGLDEVWWLVTPGNPLKDEKSYAPYDDRLCEAKIVANHAQIIVSDFERVHDLQYTIDTMAALQRDFPATKFVWLMGADSLENFHRWKDWREIANTMPIAVFSRPGSVDAATGSIAAKYLREHQISEDDAKLLVGLAAPAWIFISSTNNPISSTEIRANEDERATGVQNVGDLYAPHGPLEFFYDLHPDLGDFLTDVVEGLSASPKTISPKYFYDELGSKIFQKITDLEAYYPTRTEKEVFLKNAEDITAAIGDGAAVFEYGSGASEKIEWLMNGLEEPAAYVAMDISKTYLLENASAISGEIAPPVAAVCADFNTSIQLPDGFFPNAKRWLGFFPGSTIGNMPPAAAAKFLERASETLGEGAKFLLGVDLEKESNILNAAYNDPEGVTAAFNLNLLARMKRELDAELNLDDFEHFAFYNEVDSRIEMHLRAVRETQIIVNGRQFPFSPRETIHTENSYKYSTDRLKALFASTPWRLERMWTDPKNWFAACLLSNN
ncbi:MAG: L-histidine N(alpha)-methyltransferase [Marinicaulis sp.]|nr:L-histidine N(alpha)-methyltransferase [Marinicaulis sp.]